jgi:hypothetical protein
MMTWLIFSGFGLGVALASGYYCEYFLRRSVTAEPREELHHHEQGGGGKELGVLERVLFLVSLLVDNYTIAGGWLAFKVAAKWAAWQHVIKISEKETGLEDRLTLSSRLLGRFLNGTLYNALCAFAGLAAGKLLQHFAENIVRELSGFGLMLTAGGITTILVCLLVSALFWDWPPHDEEGKPRLRHMPR